MLDRYHPENWPISQEGVIHTLIALGAALLAAFLVHWVIFMVLRKITRSSSSLMDDVIVEKIRKPMRFAMIAFAINIAAENDALRKAGEAPRSTAAA